MSVGRNFREIRGAVGSCQTVYPCRKFTLPGTSMSDSIATAIDATSTRRTAMVLVSKLSKSLVVRVCVDILKRAISCIFQMEWC